MQKKQIDEIKKIIKTNKNEGIIIFFTLDKKYIIVENHCSREATKDEIKDLLTRYPKLKVEVFTIEMERFNPETQSFVRSTEPVLPELIRGRCLFTDFDGPHRLLPYIQHAASGKGVITIRDVKQHIDSQGFTVCDAPGVWKILMP